MIQTFAILGLAACAIGAARVCLSNQRKAEADNRETDILRWKYATLILSTATLVLVGLAFYAYIEWLFPVLRPGQ